ncbi:MAG: hypothetical protein ACI86H_001449 [bacterium]
MEHSIKLEDVKQAWANKDPDLGKLIVQLADSKDHYPDNIREGAFTFQEYWQTIRDYYFQYKPKEEQKNYRIEKMKLLESPDTEVPLPERLQLFRIILELWETNGTFERNCLFDVIEKFPLRWGSWKGIKKIFKESEERNDTEMLGAISARLDRDFADPRSSEIRPETVGYLVRRAWRYLRRMGQNMPALYPDTAADFLRFYSDNTRWSNTWISNHIFFHDDNRYGSRRFTYYQPPSNLIKKRAFSSLWKRTPRPLFSLLERAKAEKVREFAIESLKTDFLVELRKLDTDWIIRLISSKSTIIDEFVVWLLTNIPKFEQGEFKNLGLHEPVLSLLHSKSSKAADYAAKYARTYARDLPIEQLILLINSESKALRELALDLLKERDPRKDVGLDIWSSLLGTSYGHKIAVDILLKHFTAQELTPAWFKNLLLGKEETPNAAFKFATKHLLKIHSVKSLTPQYFYDLFYQSSLDSDIADFIFNQAFSKIPIEQTDVELLKHALVHDNTGRYVRKLIQEDKLKLSVFGVGFLKTLAFQPDHEGDAWIQSIKKKEEERENSNADYALDWDLTSVVLEWLGDVRNFQTSDLGFDWLMKLAKRTESEYHDFAVDYMIKAFVPADFATTSSEEAETTSSAVADFDGQSFVFTGKLKTMTRKDAQNKVKGVSGVNASGVTAKLNYLVIGDEGSSLYGAVLGTHLFCRFLFPKESFLYYKMNSPFPKIE